MNMKEHILTALNTQFQRWESLLTSLDDEQIAAPQRDWDWSIKDMVAHLWAWQQRSIAHLEAAVHDREPEFPPWLPGLDRDGAGSTDRINAWIYETNREQPWPTVHQNWHDGFRHFWALGKQISERDLLDGSHYPWLAGHSLAAILIASYDHHQEHWEKLSREQTAVIRNRSMPPGVIIPELAYPDVPSAVAWLCQTFGFQERLRIGEHRAQLVFGGESVIVVARRDKVHDDTLPAAVTHSLMVQVPDVDRHHSHAQPSGARILQPPQTYPYGERQYTAVDPGGHTWTFSQAVADVAPEEWGGQLVSVGSEQ
jgi:uncharacterized glyoxalase superfamily protein PhnB